jgi:hypothetical protein
MKKALGLILIAFGLALIVFVIYNFFQEKNKIISPIPEEKGVKVIYISPTK